MRCSSSLKQPPYLCYLAWYQFCFDIGGTRRGLLCEMIRTAAGSGAPFVLHVGHIVVVGAQEQVPWVHAWRVVTSMKDLHAYRYSPLSESPSYSMGIFQFGVKGSMPITMRVP